MESLLDIFLKNNDKQLDEVQATFFDARSAGSSWWEATLTLDEERDEDDDTGEGFHLVVLRLTIDEADGHLVARYLLDYVVNEVGVEDRVSLILNSAACIEQSIEWFDRHYKTYDLNDVVLPIAKRFFEQTNPLLSSL